jgi:hypothetical protein
MGVASKISLPCSTPTKPQVYWNARQAKTRKEPACSSFSDFAWLDMVDGGVFSEFHVVVAPAIVPPYDTMSTSQALWSNLGGKL